MKKNGFNYHIYIVCIFSDFSFIVYHSAQSVRKSFQGKNWAKKFEDKKFRKLNRKLIDAQTLGRNYILPYQLIPCRTFAKALSTGTKDLAFVLLFGNMEFILRQLLFSKYSA